MIKLYVDATKSQIECIASGDTKMICTELACVIPSDIEELVRQETGHTAEVIATCVAESFRETLTGLRE